VIGPYKLVQQIGEGGMGTVWMAQQIEPVKRLVALKLIKAGLDSSQVLARFEAERQALALMDHPNIARVLDAGTTADGRPYFVMELVKGVPLTRYCDEHGLTPKERLELFVPVCQAVQHAHQKGIIHRDLKPSNILIALYDGKPVPKVIDFGVAKAAGQQLTEHTLVTGFGAIVGTLEYMSPEQAELNQLDIDTRSDIYSLGVLLYELLTGTTPLERKRLKAAGLLEALRIIREEETPRPSARLSITAELPSVAANRGLEPRKLSGLVRGELDWIVMKALEKDRSRRYETASALAADVQRYLNDEPVQACPPSAWYRCRKFARRNKGALAVVGLILFFLVLLGGAGLWWAQQRAGAAGEAGAALAEATDLLEKERWPEALSAARRAEAVLAGVGAVADLRRQVHELIRDLEMAERLQEAPLAGIRARKFDRFHVEAPEAAYAAAFLEYGLDVEGLDAPAVAQEIRSRRIHTQLVAALDDWARVGKHLKRPGWRQRLAVARAADPDAWRNRLRDALEREDPKALEETAAAKEVDTWPVSTIALLGTLAEGTPAGERVAAVVARVQQRHPGDFWINARLGNLLSQARPPRLEEAIRYYTAAVAIRPQNPIVHYNLARMLRDKGRLDQAITENREAIRFRNDFPDAHLNLGNILADQGRLEEAIAEWRLAIASRQDFPAAHLAHHCLGFALERKGRLDEAIAEYRKAVRLKKDDPDAYYDLGNALKKQGRLKEAIAEYREAIRLKKDYPDAYYNLGLALHDQGRVEEAIAEYREAIRLKRDFPKAYTNLGNALKEQDRLKEAIAAYREAIQSKQPFPHAHLAHSGLGGALLDQGRLEEAIAECREAIRLKRDSPEAYYTLGIALRRKSRLGEAIAAYREAIRLKKDYPEAYTNLGNALKKQGRLKEAIAAYREAIQSKQPYPDAHLAHSGLGGALLDQGRLDEAIAEYKEAIRLKKNDFRAHGNLGCVLRAKGLLDEAIAEFRETIRLKKDDAYGHANLGLALRDQRRFDEAIAEFREAIRCKKDWADPHYELGNALRAKGRLEEAIAEFRDAIRLKKDYAEAHNNLGVVLYQKRRLEEAIAEFRDAIRLKKDLPEAHYGLGNALRAKGRLEQAVAAYREALRIQPDYAEAHCNLGFVLRQQGEFQQALKEHRRGHELGSRNPHWPYPSLQWVRDSEHLVELGARLSGCLAGTATPAGPSERIELAELCNLKHLNRAAVRFYSEAFAGQPKLADALSGRHRYNAACVAALAAAGQGKDGDKLESKERARLRRQALDWLRANLAQWIKQMEKGPSEVRPGVQTTLAHWQQDGDLATVRGEAVLAKLPADERSAWRQLWADVEKTLAKVRQENKRPEKSTKKQ
jgi:tetratricopeptide (TPR) repeat protein